MREKDKKKERKRKPKTLRTSFLIGLTTMLFCGLAGAESAGEQKPRFDHFTTGFELIGAHARASCASCHEGGNFSSVPTTCAGCHGQNGFVAATQQPTHHILTTNQCASCHQPRSWQPVVRVDHLEVIGTCASCHDGIRALGQPVNHLPTTDQCDSCHNTRAFSFARFSHTAAGTDCFSCHNGVQARGKPPDHIPASNFCDACHNTISFEGLP